MSDTKNTDKSKFVDQMLEDIAGDEYESTDDYFEDFNQPYQHRIQDEEQFLDVDALY